MQQDVRWQLKKWQRVTEWVALGLLLCANAIFLNWNAFRGYNFFDMSAFLDASWRVFCGQKPYVDFSYTSGPLHLYMNAFFFWLFGFGKTAILAHLVSVHSIVIVLTYVLARRRCPVIPSVIVALLTTACFYWPISHPWYDQSAHFWGILGVVVLAMIVPIRSPKAAFLTGLGAGAAAVFSFMCKTNIGAAYGLVFLVVLLVSEERVRALAGFALGAAAALLVTVVFFMGSLLRYVDQAIVAYGSASLNRFSFFTLGHMWLLNEHWVPAAIVGLNFLAPESRRKEHTALRVLFFGVTMVSIFSSVTGSMSYLANVPLWGLEMALGLSVLYAMFAAARDKFRRWVHGIAIFALLAVSLLWIRAAVSLGMGLTTWTYLGIDPIGNYALRSEPMRGWMCRKERGEALDQAVEYVKSHIPPEDSLLVLGDLQILYALTGRQSFRGVPFIFGTAAGFEMPSLPRLRRQVRENVLANPPRWVLLLEGPPELETDVFIQDLDLFFGWREEFRTRYDRVTQWGRYVLLKKKPEDR